MDVNVTRSQLKGNAVIPPSKSVAHRMMIGAALAGGRLEVANGGKDMAATSRCIEKLYPFIQKHLGSNNAVVENTAVLNAGESGSTLRFLLPVACALGANAIFEGEGRLKDRPLDGLIDTLVAHGAEIVKPENGQLPLKIGGKLTSGEYKIDGGVSSQYITGLLFALPLLDGDSTVTVEGKLVSANYVDITVGMLKAFGIEIKSCEDGYFVKGNQKFVCPKKLDVEGDWSSAGFMLALGVLCGEISAYDLNAASLQGDKIVVDLLRQAGGEIEEKDGVFIAKRSELSGIDFDAQNCPDAVPIMAAVLSFAKGVSHISHVDRLRDKESDRLSAIRTMLAGFGIKTEYNDDVLTVHGGEHVACAADSFNDHRMAMSAVVCAINTDGVSTVKGIECIKKSYPSFIDDVISLGASVQKIG